MADKSTPINPELVWSSLDPVERRCVDYAAILGPNDVPQAWLRILVDGKRATMARLSLASEDDARGALERLAESGIIEFSSGDSCLVGVNSQLAEWRLRQVAESEAAHATCFNALTLLALERGKELRQSFQNMSLWKEGAMAASAGEKAVRRGPASGRNGISGENLVGVDQFRAYAGGGRDSAGINFGDSG